MLKTREETLGAAASLSPQGREDPGARPSLLSGVAFGPDRGDGNGRNLGPHPLGYGALLPWRIFLKRWAGFPADGTDRGSS